MIVPLLTFDYYFEHDENDVVDLATAHNAFANANTRNYWHCCWHPSNHRDDGQSRGLDNSDRLVADLPSYSGMLHLLRNNLAACKQQQPLRPPVVVD